MDGAVRTEVLEGICVQKSAGFGIVVSRLEIVEPGFRIVVVTAVADGVDIENVGCSTCRNRIPVCIHGLDDLAPRVIDIATEKTTVGIQQCNDISLHILGVVVNSTVEVHANHFTAAAVKIVDRAARVLLPKQFAVKHTVAGAVLADALTFSVVGEGVAAVTGHASAVRPPHRFSAIDRRVAAGIVHTRLAVVGHHLVAVAFGVDIVGVFRIYIIPNLPFSVK